MEKNTTSIQDDQEDEEYAEDSDLLLFVCDNGKDNVPMTAGFVSELGEEVVFSISQSRTNGKTNGQDAMAALIRDNYECCVLCDGHDAQGDVVAQAVCKSLCQLVLERLAEIPDHVDLSSPEAEGAILEAFLECERRVMWTSKGIVQNSFVKVTSGTYEGMVGYVSDVHWEDGCYSVIIIDATSFHKPRLQRHQLECAKYTGGCTCVAFVRDESKNLVRVAVMGDTRVLLIRGEKSGLDQDPIFENLENDCFLSYPHDVFNTAELERIKTDFDSNDYEIDGPYLINPFTGCEIQPTRGFGDFDMYGAGYINQPDISIAFPLHEKSLLMIASDGIFDDQVWDFKELISFMQKKMDSPTFKDVETVAKDLHDETIKRSLKGGYVDDISFFLCCVSPPQDKSRKSAASSFMKPEPRKSSLAQAQQVKKQSVPRASSSSPSSSSSSTIAAARKLSEKKTSSDSLVNDRKKSSMITTPTNKTQIIKATTTTTTTTTAAAAGSASAVVVENSSPRGMSTSRSSMTGSIFNRKVSSSLPPVSSSSRNDPSGMNASAASISSTTNTNTAAASSSGRGGTFFSNFSINRREKSAEPPTNRGKDRSYTHDTIGSLRKASVASSSRSSRSHTLDERSTSKTRYLKDLRHEYKLGGIGKVNAATVRRTHGPSYSLPDGPDNSEKLVGKQAAQLLKASAVHHLTNDGISIKADSAKSKADLEKANELDKLQEEYREVNAVLLRIAKRFGHDPAKLEQLLKDIDVV